MAKSRLALQESRDEVSSSARQLAPPTSLQAEVARRKSSEQVKGNSVQLKVTLAQATKVKDPKNTSRDKSLKHEGRKKESGMTYLEKIKIEINRK